MYVKGQHSHAPYSLLGQS